MRHLTVFLAATCLGGVTAVAVPAAPAWFRHSAAGCWTNQADFAAWLNAGSQSGWGVVWPVPAWGQDGIGEGEFLRMICPIRDDDWLPKSTLTRARVFVRDHDWASGVFWSRACMGYYYSYGGGCGAYETSTNSDWEYMDLTGSELTYWGPSYHYQFGYLDVWIPGERLPIGSDEYSLMLHRLLAYNLYDS